MRLHEQKDDFADLIEITAHWIGIPAAAVKRDYFIVQGDRSDHGDVYRHCG